MTLINNESNGLLAQYTAMIEHSAGGQRMPVKQIQHRINDECRLNKF